MIISYNTFSFYNISHQCQKQSMLFFFFPILMGIKCKSPFTKSTFSKQLAIWRVYTLEFHYVILYVHTLEYIIRNKCWIKNNIILCYGLCEPQSVQLSSEVVYKRWFYIVKLTFLQPVGLAHVYTDCNIIFYISRKKVRPIVNWRRQ